MPIDRERRVIRYLVVKIEATKPAVRKVKLKLLAQPPLGADAVTIADDQHPDHQLGINRGPANAAIKRRQLIARTTLRPLLSDMLAHRAPRVAVSGFIEGESGA